MSKLLLISNLSLGEKLVRASAPKILNSFGKFGGNPWDALRASRILASKKPMSSLMVPRRGLEPPSPCGRYHLKVVRLPISPPGQVRTLYYTFSLFFSNNWSNIFINHRLNRHFLGNKDGLVTLHVHHACITELAANCLSRLLTNKVELGAA